MKTNVGAADRAIRFLAVAMIAILYFTNSIHGMVAIILVAVAVIFAFTSFTGFCPLYFLLKVSTIKKKTI